MKCEGKEQNIREAKIGAEKRQKKYEQERLEGI